MLGRYGAPRYILKLGVLCAGLHLGYLESELKSIAERLRITHGLIEM